MARSTTFGELLDVFWLRSAALWREIDIHAIGPFVFLSPSLDLGCGDGSYRLSAQAAMVRMGDLLNHGAEPAFHCYILEK